MGGEIRVEALSGGRKITLDPLEERDLKVSARRVESTLAAGFKVGWVDGTLPDGRELEVCVGAGVGSEWLTAHIGDKQYAISVRAIIDALLAWADE
jgi:hypothetical protein